MTLRKIVFTLALACLVSLPLLAGEDVSAKAPELFEQGNVLLVKGDMQAALDAYKAAAKADPQNAEYAAQAKLVNRVIQLRTMVETKDVSAAWHKWALSLHSFYLRNKIYTEALSLNKFVHAKVDTGDSAAMLAETLLEMNLNADALKLLKELQPEKVNLQTNIYLSIALARLGKIDHARKVASELKVAEDAGPGLLYDVARIHALLGERNETCQTLTLCFERTPPTQLAAVKGFVKECVDFKVLASQPGFAAAMKTQSKIQESGCSGGSSCATCPNRAGCSSGAGSDDAKKEGGCGSCGGEKSDADCDSCKEKAKKDGGTGTK